jgi:hypothetical protein
MVREYGNKILGGAGTNVAERSALADLKALRAGKPSEISRQSKSPAAISRRSATLNGNQQIPNSESVGRRPHTPAICTCHARTFLQSETTRRVIRQMASRRFHLTTPKP